MMRVGGLGGGKSVAEVERLLAIKKTSATVKAAWLSF